MNIAPLQQSPADNPADNVPIDRLAGDGALTPRQKVAEVSRQFEALLLRQILQETQKTVIQSSYADNSTTAGIYHDMVINQLAESISKSGTLGLAQSLQKQLGHQTPLASTAGPGLPAGSQPTSPPGKHAVRPNPLNVTRPLSITLNPPSAKTPLTLHLN